MTTYVSYHPEPKDRTTVSDHMLVAHKEGKKLEPWLSLRIGTFDLQIFFVDGEQLRNFVVALQEFYKRYDELRYDELAHPKK